MRAPEQTGCMISLRPLCTAVGDSSQLLIKVRSLILTLVSTSPKALSAPRNFSHDEVRSKRLNSNSEKFENTSVGGGLLLLVGGFTVEQPETSTISPIPVMATILFTTILCAWTNFSPPVFIGIF